jgi:hypothetical protein
LPAGDCIIGDVGCPTGFELAYVPYSISPCGYDAEGCVRPTECPGP